MNTKKTNDFRKENELLTNKNHPTLAVGLFLERLTCEEAGQLMLTLNGEDLENTVVGRTTGASQIVESTILTTTNSVLTVRNLAGNATALTITPVAGGARAVSPTLSSFSLLDCYQRTTILSIHSACVKQALFL